MNRLDDALVPAEQLRALTLSSIKPWKKSLRKLCADLGLPRDGTKEQVVHRIVESEKLTFAILLEITAKADLEQIADTIGMTIRVDDDTRALVATLAKAAAAAAASAPAQAGNFSMAIMRAPTPITLSANSVCEQMSEIAMDIFNKSIDAPKKTRREDFWQQRFQRQLIARGIMHDREYTLVNQQTGGQIRADFVIHVGGDHARRRFVIEMKRVKRWPIPIDEAPKFKEARRQVNDDIELLNFYHFAVCGWMVINFPLDAMPSGAQLRFESLGPP